MTSADAVPTLDPAGRRALIDAAVAAIEEEGLGGISLRSIAKRAGVSHAAPAYHFRDKAGLFTAVAVEGFALLESKMAEALAVEDAGDRLRAFGVAYVAFATEHRPHFEVMFRPELVHPDDPELQRAGMATFELLRRAVESARDEGFWPGWDVDDLALAAWALVHGIVQLTAHGVLGQLGIRVDAVELAARLTRLGERGDR